MGDNLRKMFPFINILSEKSLDKHKTIMIYFSLILMKNGLLLERI